MGEKGPVDRFWDAYLQSLPPAEAHQKRCFEVFHFGNSERMANDLADLVARGIKSATSALLWEYEIHGKPLMKAGDLSIVTNWNRKPVCIIETAEVRIVPFKEVDAEFVYDYGEGDRSMNWWQKNMWDYYAEECRIVGKTPAPEMPTICERFRVVFPT